MKIGEKSGLKANLFKINQKTRTGFDRIVSGWGITNETIIPQQPEVLQKVSVSLFDQKLCSDSYIEFNTSEEIICTKEEKPKSRCSRDSGSPLQWKINGYSSVQ